MKTIILTILLCIVSIQISNAQWQADVRLTNDPALSRVIYGNSWAIASDGDNVHVVWQDERDGNREVYYKRSIDGGVNWGADTRLTNAPDTSGAPGIAVNGSLLIVTWQDKRDGNYEIYYKRSTDGGVSWGNDTRLTNDPAMSQTQALSVNGSNIHVVWSDARNGNTFEIYYKRSTDSGLSWGADTRITNDPAQSFNSTISVSGSVVHIVWTDSRDGNAETYYKGSSDGGLSWGTDTNLSNNSASSFYPSISVSALVVHVVWSDSRDGNTEIYYKKSTDNGISWGADTRMTNDQGTSNFTNIAVSGTIVHVVWKDTRDLNDQIYYKRSTDSGISWENDIHLSQNLGLTDRPTVSASGLVVHTVWMDTRDGNWEIYYKRDPTGNPIGIVNINTEIPQRFLLFQNYPNPFNPGTKIRFSISNNSLTRLVVYDAIGREAAILVYEQLSAGTYEVDWNASNYPSGVYFYSLSSGDFNQTNKMILIK